MRDIWITHPALILCYRIVFCAKPVPTFAHDALGRRLSQGSFGCQPALAGRDWAGPSPPTALPAHRRPGVPLPRHPSESWGPCDARITRRWRTGLRRRLSRGSLGCQPALARRIGQDLRRQPHFLPTGGLEPPTPVTPNRFRADESDSRPRPRAARPSAVPRSPPARRGPRSSRARRKARDRRSSSSRRAGSCPSGSWGARSPSRPS